MFSRIIRVPLLKQFGSRSLFIQTLTTPNENALRFVPNGATILPSQKTPTVEINNIKEAIHKSELAMKLLSLNDKAISSILFGYDFITVVKYSEDNEVKNKNKADSVKPQSWSVLKPQIFALLTEHLTMGGSVLSPEYFQHLQKIDNEEIVMNENNESDDEFDKDLTPEEEVVLLIKELLTTRIQPAIQEDGGDIKFIKFDHEQGIVYLKLIGACKSCSSSEITLKSGIEDMLKYYIDEVKSVQQVLDGDANDIDNVNEDVIIEEKKSFIKHTVDELPPSL